MSLSNSQITLKEGERFALTAFNYGSSVSWQSTDPSIATVSSSGVVKAVAPGTTTIWARGSGSVKCDVRVQKKIMTISPSSLILNIGESAKLVVSDNSPHSSVSWDSSSPSVATVSSTGIVTAVGPGTTLIWAKGSKYVSCKVRVVDAPRSIMGRITNERGNPLAGASIIVVGTSRSVTSDGEGYYSVTVNAGDVLCFKYRRYKDVTVEVGYEPTLDVIMKK